MCLLADSRYLRIDVFLFVRVCVFIVDDAPMEKKTTNAQNTQHTHVCACICSHNRVVCLPRELIWLMSSCLNLGLALVNMSKWVMSMYTYCYHSDLCTSDL